MSATMMAAGLVLPMAEEGESHFPPKSSDFWQPLWQIPGTEYYFTRPMLLMSIATGILVIWLWASTRKAAVVPGKGQWLTEQVYNFARNGIARDMIGSRDFMRFVPFIFALFTFILLNNWFGIVPPFQNPPMARIAFPIVLTAMVYLLYHWIGYRHAGGFGKYIGSMLPSGLPGWIKPFILLLELITFFITRPLTLALRLWGNMFAGHMLLVIFIVGGWELLKTSEPGLMAAAIPAWALAVILTAFEGLIQFLQAYVFALLTASYIGGALADEH